MLPTCTKMTLLDYMTVMWRSTSPSKSVISPFTKKWQWMTQNECVVMVFWSTGVALSLHKLMRITANQDNMAVMILSMVLCLLKALMILHQWSGSVAVDENSPESISFNPSWDWASWYGTQLIEFSALQALYSSRPDANLTSLFKFSFITSSKSPTSEGSSLSKVCSSSTSLEMMA